MSEVIENIKARKLTERLAERFGIDPDAMMRSLKATAFNAPNITNEQLMALCVVSEQYGLNPWLKEIYAYPAKGGGIIPVVGVDGWARIINSNPQFDGMDFEQDAESCTCVIYRKDRSHPVKVTEYMAECRKEGMGPWMTHPKRMLRHKAMIQCARIAFGFAGIYDPDEAERVIEGEVVSEQRKSTSVTQTVIDEQQTVVDEAKLQEYLASIRAAVSIEDKAGILELYAEMDHDMELVSWRNLDSKSRTWIRKVRDEN